MHTYTQAAHTSHPKTPQITDTRHTTLTPHTNTPDTHTIMSARRFTSLQTPIVLKLKKASLCVFTLVKSHKCVKTCKKVKMLKISLKGTKVIEIVKIVDVSELYQWVEDSWVSKILCILCV